ncbi:acyltransferase [Streptomyces avermitilis]|uniref:acyltransferase n=1 Tax=Streptomyces avermitilis TaxID=33903 RepID=UPI0033AC4FAD
MAWATCDSALCVGVLTVFREAVTRSTRLSAELAADSSSVYILHVPLVAALQYCLANRGLSAASAWAATSVLTMAIVPPPAAAA